MTADRHALALVDASYRIAEDPQAWLSGLLTAAQPLLERGHGSFAVGFRLERGDGSVTVTDSCHSPELSATFVAQAAAFARGSEVGVLRRIYADDQPIETASDMWRRVGGPASANPVEAIRALGFAESIGVKAYDPSGVGVNLCAMLDTPLSLGPAEIERWRLLRSHILAGMRLRSALDEDAVLDPGGDVLHAEGDAREPTALEALRSRAVEIERARSGPGRRDPAEALRAWQALVEGRWSLVDRFDRDGRRYLIARRNDPDVVGPRPLSRRERQVVAYAAMGYANKHIAYALGLAPSTVSSHLRRAMRVLGARSRADLARVWAHAGALAAPT